MTINKDKDWREAAAGRAGRAGRAITAVERDFDLDDSQDGDDAMDRTPPDVVLALGFDPAEESKPKKK